MQKDKSFFTTFEQTNINWSKKYPNSRSLSFKSFAEQKNMPPLYKNYVDKTHEYRKLNQNMPGIDQSDDLRKRNLFDINSRSKSQYYSNVYSQQMAYPINYTSEKEQKNYLYRSKSSNQVYQFHRINMLHKINNQLQNHIAKRNQETQKFIKIQKQPFQSQVITRLQRLQKYLEKIKSLRGKQRKPKQILQNLHKNKKQELPKQVSQQTAKHLSKPSKNQYVQAISELDKIKNQLLKVRLQAISVKERNSLSRNKKQNPQNQQKYKNTQILQTNKNQFLLNYKHQFKKLEESSPEKLKQLKQSVEKTYCINKNFKEIRMNNHINHNYTPIVNSVPPNKIYENSVSNFKKISSKPKITFSFNNKI